MVLARLPYIQQKRVGLGIKKTPIKEKPIVTPSVIKTKRTSNPYLPLTPEQIATFKAKKIREQKTREIVKEKVKELCLRGLTFLDVSIRLQNQGFKASQGFVQSVWKEIHAKDPSLIKKRFEATESRRKKGGIREAVFEKIGLFSAPKESRQRKTRQAPTKKSTIQKTPPSTKTTPQKQQPSKKHNSSKAQLKPAPLNITQAPRILHSSKSRALIESSPQNQEHTFGKTNGVHSKIQQRLAPWEPKRKPASTMPKTYKEDVTDFLKRTGIKQSNFEKMLNRYKIHFGQLLLQDPSAIADRLKSLGGQEKLNINYAELLRFAQWASTRKWKELKK